MRVEIDDYGSLNVFADAGDESEKLTEWYHRYDEDPQKGCSGCHGQLGIGTRGPTMKTCQANNEDGTKYNQPDGEKVYCGKCRYFVAVGFDGWIFGSQDQCQHKLNIKQVDTVTEQRSCIIRTPDVINKNNDCPNFEEKRWKRFIKSLKNIISFQ